ncbi:MAG: VOC family protein [Candidatus Competibacteraceae bacterium]|nr:VOC family protein [Candidatus Competibacteraceae bacterium]
MIYRFRIITFAALLILATAATAQTEPVRLPPLTDPPSEIAIPGKFVWADLFSADVVAARDFYQQLFGWQWQSVDGDVYSIAFSEGRPVAGLVSRSQQSGETTRARWIYYASVPDVAATAAAVVTAGGRTLIDPQSMPDRGDYAIFADPQGALFGVIHSSSGDPPDYREPPNRWIWIQLLTTDVERAVDFYSNLLGYQVYAYKNDIDRISDRILASGGYARAAMTLLRYEADFTPAWTAFIRVDDIGQSIARALALGGEVVLPPTTERLDGKVAIISDPLGAALGLLEWQYPEEEQP